MERNVETSIDMHNELDDIADVITNMLKYTPEYVPLNRLSQRILQVIKDSIAETSIPLDVALYGSNKAIDKTFVANWISDNIDLKDFDFDA